MYLGGLQPILVLLSLLLAPIILVGSAFVQGYVFFSWLENRALAKALRRAPRPAGPIAARLRKAGIDLGTMPPVPWILAFVFLFLPLSMLVAILPGVGMALIALHIVSPVVFARLDR
jgi:putative flippase GtrA